MQLIGDTLKFFKKHPTLIMDFIEKSKNSEVLDFMNSLPMFYFDYTQIDEYSKFLKQFFLKRKGKGMLSYLKDKVRINFIDLGSTFAYIFFLCFF